jgi:endonuclease/exonuclease/phosphatase family metal-dependent hydrolase
MSTMTNPPQEDFRPLRILSYNIRSLRDDRCAVATVITRRSPDVVCLQEAPRLWRWRAQCAWLASTTGMVIASGGREAAGNLIMVAEPSRLVSSQSLLLSPRPGFHRRGVAMVELRWANHSVAVASVHFSIDQRERRAHLSELWTVLSAGSSVERTIVTGDLNEIPGGAVWRSLSSRLSDAFGSSEATFPARHPTLRLDGIFVGSQLRVEEADYDTELDSALVRRASDHLPIMADVTVMDGTGTAG